MESNPSSDDDGKEKCEECRSEVNLELTEQRVIPTKMNPRNGLLLEHIARYIFASYFARGRILDIACGAGYGMRIIKGRAPGKIDEIVGADLAGDAVAYAESRYGGRHLKFVQANILDPRLPDRLGQFDTIISLETVEHVRSDKRVTDNFVALLADDGTLVFSSPFGQGRGEPCGCEYHAHQFTVEEFEEIAARFPFYRIYHQRDTVIEMPRPGEKYWLGLAVCRSEPFQHDPQEPVEFLQQWPVMINPAFHE